MIPNRQDSPTAQAQLLAYMQHHRIWQVEDILYQWLATPPMASTDPLQLLNQLKTWLDAFRPLPPAVVAELRHRYLGTSK